MTRLRLIIFSLFLFSLMPVLNAQNVLTGVVKDDAEGFPIPYVKVTVNVLGQPIATNEKGEFNITIPKETATITFDVVGYNQEVRTITFSSKKRKINLEVRMVPSAQVLDAAVIQSDKYETKVEVATSSIAVLKPKSAEGRNVTTADALINTVGGIAVVDNEPQIRGGSGFSSGMGSRVMILLDDMPLLRPDAGRPMWAFIPMENVEQVDIIKGAASVVFGSSALTGAINVHSAYPHLKPKTKVTIYGGIYSKPENKNETSWNHRNPVKYGASFMHSRIIKKNFDFVIGGEFFNDEGYIGPEEKVEETRNTDGRVDGHVVENRGKFGTRGKYETRGRLNFNTRYRFEKVKGLSISLNGNFMYDENAQSFFWNDGFDNKYRSYKGSLSYFKDFTFYLDPTVKYVGAKGSVHSFNNRILYSDNQELSGSQSARSLMVFDEYQYNKSFKKIGLSLIAGANNTYCASYGAVFNGIKGDDTPVGLYSDNFSIYTQLEEKLLKNKNLTLQLGGRWEFYKLYGADVKSEFQQKPIFRAGINYQVNKSKTSFRASIGQGFRFPSIGEKYIAISVGQYGFYPNPNLKSETSWNAEIGIMQPFMVSRFRGMIDVAVYDQEFKDFIEFSMGQWGSTGSIMERMGFMYLNIGPARISGVDVNFMGEGKIGKDVSYNISLSYTYSHPATKDKDYVYYTHPSTGKEFTFNNSSSDTSRDVLKYRIEHMAKGDLEFVFFKKFNVGVSVNYYSQMKNIDKFFFEYDGANPNNSEIRNKMYSKMDLPFYGFYQYYQTHKNGSITLDARIGYTFEEKVTVTFIVKNILNASYCLRPMYMEPLRTFNIQFVYDLN